MVFLATPKLWYSV